MLLNRTSYLIRHRFDDAKQVETYDIMDPETRSLLGTGLEVEPKGWLRPIRWAVGRNMFPTAVWVYEHDPWRPSFCVRELKTIWAPRLEVTDSDGQPLCYFQGKFATVGGGFGIQDSSGRNLATLENEPGTWRYQFLGQNGRQIGTVEEQIVDKGGPWADWTQTYLAACSELAGPGRVASVLLLATALALDVVYRDRM